MLSCAGCINKRELDGSDATHAFEDGCLATTKRPGENDGDQ